MRIAARERPALVHCNDHNTMWAGLAVRALWGGAVVYDSHELWADRNLRPEWRPGSSPRKPCSSARLTGR